MPSHAERIRIFCTDIGVNEPVKIGNSTVSVEDTAGPNQHFLVIREGNTNIVNQEAGEKERVHCFFFTLLSEKNDDNEFCLHKFIRNMSLDDFLKRLREKDDRHIYGNTLFEAEVLITNYRKVLTDHELNFLAKVLDNYYRVALERKKIVDKIGREHNFVIAKLTKQIIEPNVLNKSVSRRRYTRGEFVLSDNGTILVGRFLIGGLESLRLRKFQETLDKNYGFHGRER